tara:strand:- start:370 stop:627 length:258 start_codon:yes stop_codon:yes gene_type:complete
MSSNLIRKSKSLSELGRMSTLSPSSKFFSSLVCRENNSKSPKCFLPQFNFIKIDNDNKNTKNENNETKISSIAMAEFDNLFKDNG